MAKIEYTKPASEHFPATTEVIEVRFWGAGGAEDQSFSIGSGANFHANGTLWIEILYTVEGAQIFYTRNFVQHEAFGYHGPSDLENQLDRLVKKGNGKFGFGDILPETCVWLSLEKKRYKDEDGQKHEYTNTLLEIAADTGAVFGRTSPGNRFITIKFPDIEVEEGVRFMRELIQEVDAAHQGKHPDPAGFPEGSSEWPFALQLNRKAYGKISEHYRENYFDNPLLAQAFDGWMAQLPPGGQILDAGCGHGDPVIGRLLVQGFQVTGCDLSPEMLDRAGQAFPQAKFIQKATTLIDDRAIYDGICSFNSLLYLDLIDFLNAILRLHRALKPGGLLFLFGFNSAPSWRGEPYSHLLGQWMWSSHYSMEEAAGLLEEHGYFQVLDMQEVQVDEGEAERIAQELEKQKEEEAAFLQRQAANPDQFNFPFFPTPIERSSYAYVIVARRCEK